MTDLLFETRALRQEFFEIVAVNDVDLVIPPGGIFGLIGPNGAGKTTLLRMLASTLEPTDGKVFFEGRDIWKDPVRLRANIGFVPDFFLMYDRLKVRELLTYFGIAHGMQGPALQGRVAEVLRLIALDDKADTFVKGLSRGMMQRLGVGRAILHRPRALILDEPASGLDPLARRSLFDLLRKIQSEGTTVIISSHILAELTDLCTSVGIMLEGKIVECGNVEEIVKKIIPHRRITLRIVSGSEAARKALAADEAVGKVGAAGDGLEFQFQGTDQQLAALNARLIEAGVGIALAEEARTSLQEVYFAVAEGEGDAPSA